MKANHSILALLLLGSSATACGSGGAPGGASPDGGDAATSADVSTDAVTEGTTSERSADAPSETSSEATTGEAGDASPLGDGGASGEGAAGEAGDAKAESAPYMGSMPTAPTMALIRFANWSPDSPAVDMCIAAHGTTSFRGPLVAALAVATQSDAEAGGIAFPLASAYTLVTPGQYDARFVVAGAATCTAGIQPVATQLKVLAAGEAETVALIGEVVPMPGDYKLHISGFLDDVSPVGPTAIRVINAAPALSQIDVGTGSIASNDFLAIFRGVGVGQASTPSEGWIPFVVDANGYNPNQVVPSGNFSAHASVGMVDAVSTNRFSVPSGTVATIVVAGGTASTSPALVACADNAGTSGILSDCTVLAPAGM